MSESSKKQSVSELFGRHQGEDIYILGTGTSARVFPMDFLKGKTIIGLNMAWKLFPVQYCLTTRPELNIPEFIGEKTQAEVIWITKYEKLVNQNQRYFVDQNAKRFYFFTTPKDNNKRHPDEPSEAGRILEWIDNTEGDYLYLWTSVSQTAVHLAANMGAKNVILVGCDNTSLMRNHHAHQQHTFWKKENPNIRYRQYYKGLAEVRTAVRKRAVNVVSLNPFLGIGYHNEDFTTLCKELDVPIFIENKDISHLENKKHSFITRLINSIKSILP